MLQNFWIVSDHFTTSLRSEVLGMGPSAPGGGGLLTLKRPMSLSYRNKLIDLICKSIYWFLYKRDIGL